MYSDTLLKMINDKKGYRNGFFKGCIFSRLEDVLKHEISSLCNIDILHYAKDNYNILSDFKLDENLINKLKIESKNEDDFNFSIEMEEVEMAILNSGDFIEEILNYVENSLGKKDVKALWLTTKEKVVNIYQGNEYVIDEYIIPDKFMILSDLYECGALFVF